MKKTKNKPPYKLFGLLFLLVMAIVIVNNLRKKTEVVHLAVPNNAGVTGLETVGDRLVAVFKDGQIAVWNWGNPPARQADFSLKTNRIVLPDAERLAAVNESGKKMLSLHTLATGQKIKDIAAGWPDQDVWPRISFDKKVLALIRQNPPDSARTVLFEFLTADCEKAVLGIPVTVSLQADTEAFIDYAVDGTGLLYAVGSKEEIGRIAALNLQTGQTVWDKTFDQTKEFCSLLVSPDNQTLLAGNRDGRLYKISAGTGAIVKPIQLLEAGETRPITNDYSVLNLAYSPDGQYYAATINPKVYLLKTGTDAVFHTATPADRLTSRVAFSPDNQQFATSDIRQGFPIKVWPLPQSNN